MRAEGYTLAPLSTCRACPVGAGHAHAGLSGNRAWHGSENTPIRFTICASSLSRVLLHYRSPPSETQELSAPHHPCDSPSLNLGLGDRSDISPPSALAPPRFLAAGAVSLSLQPPTHPFLSLGRSVLALRSEFGGGVTAKFLFRTLDFGNVSGVLVIVYLPSFVSDAVLFIVGHKDKHQLL
ncbi:hypothetical protein DFH08DRAFT_978289 [Mycena albidolilacea]|uniref:Uncharacterized protein n=1 Tax=Mycena albidolilacea TaxID=1033008 RepID=A0AAD6YZM7_9AGAR|nr:hypothetical protein DFH08DRAFT_978289 [Mycena albidolilacea]